MIKKYSLVLFLGLLFLLIIYVEYQKNQAYQKENQAKIDRFTKNIEIDRRRESPINLPILVYHYVEIVTDERDTIRKSLNVLPSVFESQINLLLKNGYYPIKLNDLVNYYNNQAVLPEKPFMLTFDDGYKDFYTDVFPILNKHQIPATLYVTAGFIDSTHNYLTQDELLKISQSKLVEIGAHGTYHYNLTYANSQIIKEEIIESKNRLESLLKKPIKHFAYPYGGYSEEAIETLKNSGYETAVTMDNGNIQSYDNRYLLKRFRPGSTTGDYFLSLLK